MVEIGLIGDFDEAVLAHGAIPRALELVAGSLGTAVDFEWLPTESLESGRELGQFHGLWSVPGSPYHSMDGALRAIRHAREQRLPFLGTCAGLQHAVIEYARNVLGWQDAEHAETAPDADEQLITPLRCEMVDVTGVVRFHEGSRLRAAHGAEQGTEGYRCSYGLNPTLQARLIQGPLRVAATDMDGDARALELDEHPFFVLTLYQPERAALRDVPPPIVSAFVAACVAEARVRC